MSEAAITIARPYAEAVFERASESDALDAWSGMLAFLAMAAADPTLAAVIANPLYDRQRLAVLIIDIAGKRLSKEGANFVRVLAENNRLQLLPEMRTLYEQLKAESLRTIKVQVRSAYDLTAAQEKTIVAALQQRLGRSVTIESELDPDLIGGVHIRAGDLVIDASAKGRLQQLANELGV
jgi:F-type H+-transporting ATPase subunit delta